MATFAELTVSLAPSGMSVPAPLRLLFEWVEQNGFVTTGEDGEQYGTLSEGWPRGPGTNLLLRGWRADELADYIPAWLGPVRGGLPTLWPFCRTGCDGSLAALWLAPDGRNLIVHMGSGSGSVLTCVLGDDPVDFLRLLAIGYEEICWNVDWADPPTQELDHQIDNARFRAWVETTFDVEIPQRATDIVARPAETGDLDTDDVWCRWLNTAAG